MPPSAVKTLRDLIFRQYAKIISESAGYGKRQYGFVMNRYKRLQSGEIQWSTSIREWIKEKEKVGECIFCSSEKNLTVEHLLPRSRHGPDIPDNAVWICKPCNSSKGDKRLYEFYGLENRNRIPRIAEGKYLKLIHDILEKKGILDTWDVKQLCSICDLLKKCPVKEKLTVYCLEGTFTK